MPGPVKFILSGEVRTLDAIDPTTTVLQWLRDSERRMGTKEGCAEGDCGACTVALGEPDGTGGMRYLAVNACIMPVAMLHGCELVSVEDLADGDALHPAQSAMIDEHASQCGFCTPGFVMSLFALHHQAGDKNQAEVHQALAGNLCRCTGYGPIIRAGLDSANAPPADRFASGAAATAKTLQAIRDGGAAVRADGRTPGSPFD